LKASIENMISQLFRSPESVVYVEDIHGFRPDSATSIYGMGPKTLKAWTLI
jgi:hypothetical protein